MYYFVKSSKNKAIFVKMRKALKSFKVYIFYKKNRRRNFDGEKFK